MLVGTSILTNNSRERAEALFGDLDSASTTTWQVHTPTPTVTPESKTVRQHLQILLLQSGTKMSLPVLLALSLLCGIAGAYLASFFLAAYFLPLIALLAALIPYSYLSRLADKRADEFLSDYPVILLAAASSMKAGHTVYLAFQRAVVLLPKSSLVRQEIEILLHKINAGVSRELAVSEFAASIRLPELALFRSAFLLVSEHGGRFVPTLQRLATVSRDRATLISGAKVSTASMRMTANFLLAIAPFLLVTISFRSPDFWQQLFHHPTANLLASTGATIILVNYLILRRLSAFKP